jgi:hypothetical protein
MLDKLNKQALISDLVKVATFNLVAHVLMNARYNDPLFNEKFIYSLVFILIGFTVYHIFLDYQVIAWFKEKAGKVKDAVKSATESAVKSASTASSSK